MVLVAGHGSIRPPLPVRIGGLNIAEISRLKIRDAIAWFTTLELTPWQEQVGRLLLDQVVSRLKYLDRVGVGHLSLDRPLRTLSGGEAQRVALDLGVGFESGRHACMCSTNLALVCILPMCRNWSARSVNSATAEIPWP